MKIFEFILLSSAVLSNFSVWAIIELPPGVSRRLYCETCLATVQGLRKALSTLSIEPSRTKIKANIQKACEKLTFEDQSVAVDKAYIACKHLLDHHGEKFEDAFLIEKDISLETNLCYIYSTACTDVKRKHFQGQEFQHSMIEELLQKHPGKIRFSKPVIPVSNQHKKEEL
ncbi:Hypothetical predicted protein [Pelobates cultripes]|uniref:Saposin B-type domain-containing protein n=1 Tax=Pelobates cultripes TaxID=61616 RepID=A0AAD1SQU7_PELCU|nr:Hypothetical predicted protein [Pelobates cultripes]